MSKTRILLVDDQPELVDHLRRALTEEFCVVGVANSGEELVREAPKLRPQVIVLDVSMPGMNGFEAAERVKTGLPEARIVMLSMHAGDEFVTEAFRVGASAYVLKTSGVSELAHAIREVQNGNEYLSRSLGRG